MPSQLPAAERDLKPFGCIYVVTHKETGRFYVGQTRATAQYRWSVHKSEAKLRARGYFYKAVKAHGHHAFDVQTVATATSQEHLNSLETLWILATGASRRALGYNLDAGGRGYVRSASTIEKMRWSLTGRKLTDEHRAAISRGTKGLIHTAAHNAAKSVGLKGRTPSDACRLAVSEANRRRIISPETSAKLSQAAQKANEVRWRNHKPRSNQN